MTEFAHSDVLFAGDDGLPLQFNLQNTIEKEYLKTLIEHGGGMCTFSDEAICLMSPGTKVASILSGKKFISTRYIYECVKEDCLLDIDEFIMQLNEIETSDISDNSINLLENQTNIENNAKFSDEIVSNSIDIEPIKEPLNIVNCPNSNHAFDFLDSESKNVVTEIDKSNCHLEIPLQSSENHIQFGIPLGEEKNNCVNALPDSLEDFELPVDLGHHLPIGELHTAKASPTVSKDDDPVVAVVSSSQENNGALDQFDKMILNKVQEKCIQEDEDSLSQSYTVSSSADAQKSQKEPSHHTSAEIFDGSSPAPDSPSQTTERQQYIKNLEKEVQEILNKPSPKSIQDKIILVKYICTVKKLAPAVVLQTLQKF